MGAARVDGVPAAVLERIEKARKERGWSQSELSRKAGLARTWLTGVLRRDAHGQSAGLTAESLAKVAGALGMPVQALLGAERVNTEIPFQDLVQWATETKAIAHVLLLHGERVTVGDLLRYKASPSSRGEFDADRVWEHIQALRHGLDLSSAADVTEADEQAVGPKKRARKRGT